MSTIQAVRQAVRQYPPGKPFTLEAVSDAGTPAAVRQALSRMTRAGELQRPTQGVYARPKPNRWFGQALPDPQEVAQAIAERNGERLEMHGAEAARRFGLTTQMPTQTAFYTTGRSRALPAGETTIHFEQVPARYMRYAGTETGKAVAAMLHMGPEHLTEEMVQQVLTQLEPADRARLEHQLKTLPTWIKTLFASAVGRGESHG